MTRARGTKEVVLARPSPSGGTSAVASEHARACASHPTDRAKRHSSQWHFETRDTLNSGGSADEARWAMPVDGEVRAFCVFVLSRSDPKGVSKTFSFHAD